MSSISTPKMGVFFILKGIGIYLDKTFLPILSLHGTEEKTAHQSIDETETLSEFGGRIFGIIGEWICDWWYRR